MGIIKIEPFKDLTTIHEHLNRILEENILKMVQSKDSFIGGWNPPVDIYELEDEVVMTVELPGMKQKDIHLEMKDDVLTLKGESKLNDDAKEENYLRMERLFGPFQRSFSLPALIDSNSIKASFDQGVLTVSLPKQKVPEKKKIKVKIT